MAEFQAVLLLLTAAVLLLVVARRSRIPYPVLVAAAGMAIALMPVDFSLDVEPALVLPLFVAPVLLDAAFDTSLRDLRRNWVRIASLALVAVGLTTLAVALVVHWMVPSLPWAAAVALGAIVAPPDAAAAATVLRDVRLPHRIAVVIEGEALLNDASALLIYRLAVASALGGQSTGVASLGFGLLLPVGGSLVAGVALAWLWGRLAAAAVDAASSIVLQFVGTFGIWVLAERTGLSPILTVVAYGIALGRFVPARLPARLRLPSNAVWDTAVFVVNVLAFFLIGLQLEPAISAAQPGELGRWLWVGAAVLLTIIAIRLLWGVGTAFWQVWLIRLGLASAPQGGPAPSWRTGLIISWCGTRGIVTVATALALPQGFPARNLMLFVAVTVALGTLIVHGLTLRSLVMALDLHDDDPVGREAASARLATVQAALATLRQEPDEAAAFVRAELEDEQRVAEKAGPPEERIVLQRLRSKALGVRRTHLHQMRRTGLIGDAAFHQIEEEFDLVDLSLNRAG